jgi:3-isopropylmalate dehydrogenase
MNQRPTSRWGECVQGRSPFSAPDDGVHVIGVFNGEGSGPEVIRVCLEVLSALESVGAGTFRICHGGSIGHDAEALHGAAFSTEADEFCRDVFARGGALLHGAGGGRFVYELRKRFDLFCKISPVRSLPDLRNVVRLKPEHVDDIDFIIVRENCAGIYQGKWEENSAPNGMRAAQHSFSYTEAEVRRIVEVAACIASLRRGSLTVVQKDGGVPTISKLWRDSALDIADAAGIELQFMNVDYAAYYLVQHPKQIDVMVAPNMFGDVLIDVTSVLLGSRALGYSGNFSAESAAVYQTNHGAAHDLAGKNIVNPVGQIFALAMLLRESFGMLESSCLIEQAVSQVWHQGWRTSDLQEAGCRLAGTREMGSLVADAMLSIARGIKV